jgi:hypothetical protein
MFDLFFFSKWEKPQPLHQPMHTAFYCIVSELSYTCNASSLDCFDTCSSSDEFFKDIDPEDWKKGRTRLLQHGHPSLTLAYTFAPLSYFVCVILFLRIWDRWRQACVIAQGGSMISSLPIIVWSSNIPFFYFYTCVSSRFSLTLITC